MVAIRIPSERNHPSRWLFANGKKEEPGLIQCSGNQREGGFLLWPYRNIATPSAAVRGLYSQALEQRTHSRKTFPLTASQTQPGPSHFLAAFSVFTRYKYKQIKHKKAVCGDVEWTDYDNCCNCLFVCFLSLQCSRRTLSNTSKSIHNRVGQVDTFGNF